MTYTITKQFDFSASHVLDGLPRGHQCARLHGHNYSVRVGLTGNELDKVGFILDYGELAPVKQFIDARLDHRHLNDSIPGSNPTAENLARWLADRIAELIPIPPDVTITVGVSETPKTWAWWTP